MNPVFVAILGVLDVLLKAAPELWHDVQNLLANHPSNPNNAPLGPAVVAGTQDGADALNNTVIK